MVDCFHYIIHTNTLSFNTDGVGLEDVTGLVMSKTASLYVICYMELLFRRSDKAYGISIVLVAICAWKDFVFIEVHIIRPIIVVGS